LENQQIEWKESWHDEHLKCICAFANAQGGILEIGKNDKGEIVGLQNSKKLLEDIPNKINSSMGILADVNSAGENDKNYITVKVNPYPNTISYHGKFYYRSGSTTQELNGNALTEFMFRKQGRNWDDVLMPNVKPSDLDVVAFREFRKKAILSKRLTKKDLDLSNEELLYNLQLIEGKFLKRAAVLLFHEKPEDFVTGAWAKIGFFENDADLLYYDEIHGPLITMPDKVIETVYLKFFKAIISYEGIQRVETYPVPREAMREAVLNAIAHKDYNIGAPIQIKVFSDKVTVYNTGGLSKGWTIKKLLSTHHSILRNPSIAGTFFRSGMIEGWGRGIKKINDACKEEGKPKPKFETTDSDMTVTFYSETNFTTKFTTNFTANIIINDSQKKILELMSENPKITIKILSENLNVTERSIKNNIKILKELKLISRIGATKNGRWIVKRK
jgi:ATP-dependent DNA helicase RecG